MVKNGIFEKYINPNDYFSHSFAISRTMVGGNSAAGSYPLISTASEIVTWNTETLTSAKPTP